MDHLYFDTLSEPASDRTHYWGHVNRGYFGALQVDCLDDGPLDAQLSAFEVGPLRMFRITAPAHRIRRNMSLGELPSDGSYKLVLQLSGEAEICQHDRAFRLRPGDWSLYDPRVDYSITNFERSDLLVVLVPRLQLKGFRVPNLHTSEATSSNQIGLHAVLSSFLRSLAEQLPTLSNGVGQPLSETVFGLLASTLGTYQAEAVEYATLPAVLKARVKQYVQTHLGEGDLSIDRIALDMRCSKRYLHRVFEDAEITLDRYIWQARLERCRAALAAPGTRTRSVSEIAFGCGFNSSAHFCRLFKGHFGVSPRAYQREAASQAAVAPAFSH
ncbi:MAG: helix-turn-helix domain-containing protein [Burkholderiaceae bacterium]